MQISTSAERGPHPPLFPATLIGFSVGSEELTSRVSVIVEAGGQTVVVEKSMIHTGDNSLEGAVSRLVTTMSSMILMSFSNSPATNDGNMKKKPINKKGMIDNSELIEVRFEEFGGIQYQLCGLSFCCRLMLRAVAVALKTVVLGDGDGKVKDGEDMLVLVGSARAIGISMAERRRRARRMAILVAPGLVAGMFVATSMACFATDSERLTSTLSGSRRPARR